MKNINKVFILLIVLINCLCTVNQNNLLNGAVNVEEMHEINQEVEDNVNYKKVEFSFDKTDTYQFFKYENSTLPSSKIAAFRIDFSQFSVTMNDYKVYCTNVESSTSDSDLIATLKQLTEDQSSCVDGFRSYGYFDAIVKLDPQKTKLGIVLISTGAFDFTATLFFRITERILGVNEEKPMEEENYSLVPFTVNISQFREISKSKILFYSETRTLQMFHSQSSTPFPELLFSGNILSVYTNPNMVRQKYHNANIMVLLANPFGFYSKVNIGEQFKFQVKLFESNYLLDYYVSSNTEGRPLNTPLLINMTTCENPYYVILNYNKKETSKTLVIDQIYGKMTYLSVATKFTQETWDEMLENDMETINLNEKKYTLPADSRIHMDVYKIECEFPLMYNFYYIDETDLHPKMDYGDVHIFTLKPYETINIPFFTVITPKIIIEIYNPYDDPIVIIEAHGETVYTKNTLIETSPFTLSNGINVRERAGLSDTRIIIKVGYSNSGWTQKNEYIKYNEEFKTYLFQFPNDLSRFNYTLAELITSGTNLDDNVKYCFTPNIGAALKPSSENCYRVSKNNPYTLKAYNPLVMYRDYEYDDQLAYYITFKAEDTSADFQVIANIQTYDTKIRNYEGINNKITTNSTGEYSSILTPPKNREPAVFLQVEVCDGTNPVKAKVKEPLTGKILVSETSISPGVKNTYMTFQNDLIDTEFFVTGEVKQNVFVRMVGLSTIYVPSFTSNPEITFDNTTNTLTVESPLTKAEKMKITVLVDKEGVISSKGFTLCNFAGVDIDSLVSYTKSVTTNNRKASIQLNFNKAKINPGQKFEAIVYFEQQTKSKMVFLSEVYSGIVGDIETDTIVDIDEEYPQDTTYLFKEVEATKDDPSYYFQYFPSEVLNVSIGAFSIEMDSSATGSFTGVACTFVNNDTDAMSMIEAVEEALEQNSSYCIGSQSTINSRRYNYIFKYEYGNEVTPKRMVIKVINGNNDVSGKFRLYMKRDQGVIVESTDFNILKEYGREENSKKSVIPYIVDVYTLRAQKSETEYVSKVLFYSQHLEMQMYYLSEDSNVPLKLFSGNIALVYTKPDLAIQKYHATTLILISENLEGQEHASLGDTFRFHTKMFKSDAQIEYFVSQNPKGRTINFPLSLEMNTCTNENNKLYYILNYNQPEQLRYLHLDMVFGKYLRARIAKEINADKWDDLIENSMSNIDEYQTDLPEKSQHIDVIEITCSTPLLLNAYYTYDYLYNNVKQGEIVVRNLEAEKSFSFSVQKTVNSVFFYTLSLFNPVEEPDVTVRFSDGTEHYITQNSLQTGMLMSFPDRISVINNCKTKTRFIFKIGFSIEGSDDWHEVEDQENLAGKLYANVNQYVYKFPNENDKKDYKNVSFTVNSINEAENVKFCYSTNLGIAMEASKENCFRTGKYIPYTLTFINPLIVGKNYQVETDKYYITFRPFNDDDFINLEIKEQKYNNLNRNEEGVPKKLTLISGNAGTILSLPKEESYYVFYQLKSCNQHNGKITYVNTNAFTQEYIHDGGIYYSDPYGVYYSSENTYLENEIQITGEAGVAIFTKHTGIDKEYTPSIIEYKVTFDESTNVATIEKPIFDEEFTFHVFVDQKDKLSSYSQCDIAFAADKSKLAKYYSSFTSVSSNYITHYIDFTNTLHYEVGTEFDLLVYAEQMNNSKMEFIYKVISGTVGKITGVQAISEFVDGETDYVTKTFNVNSASNYLYYDFAIKPVGNIASLRITSKAKVNKVGCIFTNKDATDEEMVNLVNRAVLEGTSVCVGEMQKDNDGYDALINANYANGQNKLVIQVLYGLGEDKEEKIKEGEEEVKIVLKIRGTKLGTNEGKFGEQEKLATIPYVIDLLEIRQSRTGSDYVSKVLLYSTTREMEMFYIDPDYSAPASLFTGNIMLVYTNEELIRQKYHGATTMILITDALSATESFILGEQYRFEVKYFNSAANIQYFLSSNPNGRPLNNPTAIEMTSCDQPYYYILNYNHVEDRRKLYIDTIFGERDTIKLATSLSYNSWDSLISNMEPFNGDEVVLPEETKYHFDVIEVKCKLPLLLNLFYADPTSTKVNGLEVGDITILNLEKGASQVLDFKEDGTNVVFAYSFNVLKGNNQNPNIEITFNTGETLHITENGVYVKYAIIELYQITITNKETSGSVSTRIIFKFGHVIEYNFESIQNGIYSNQNDENRKDNLFGYIYDNSNKRLNYTGVDFEVQTKGDNVKFCYSTNLGTYINPSLQNCYRVGKNNPYTISTLNPKVMYRNYESDEKLNYYVGFRTVELDQNITIIPKLREYDTTERNMEGAKNKVTIGYEGKYSTILTAPQNHDPYIFTHIHVCTKNKPLTYQFLNAYNRSSLGYDGEISPNSKNQFKTVENTKLDTELTLTADNGVEIFVKHVGISSKYQPVVKDIQINYDNNTRILNWTQPIDDEEFEYAIYIDKIDTLKKLGYTLCSIAEVTKLGHWSQTIRTDSRTPNITVPTDIGKDYEEFDCIIVAEQINNGKLTLLSPVTDSKGNSPDEEPESDTIEPDTSDKEPESKSNTGLIILIVILSVVIIAGAIFAFIVYRRYKSQGEISKTKKETSMALINSAQKDKLIESQAQEGNQQVDP